MLLPTLLGFSLTHFSSLGFSLGTLLGSSLAIPTTPWDGLWYGVAQWMDVAPDKLSSVLPNAANFEAGSTLLTQGQLYAG